MKSKEPKSRHAIMAAIRSRDTKPEWIVRRFLFSRGFRYRLFHKRLPGHPDIVMRKYRTCIFVNGCFWHGHENCRFFSFPKTNTDFGERKSCAIGNGIKAICRLWRPWGGIASPFGSANSVLPTDRTHSPHSNIHSTLFI